MSSENSPSRPTTPLAELLELTQQFTPHKTPRTVRRIVADIQSLANDVSESQSAVKRKLADVTNQLGTTRQPAKRRNRGNRAVDAPEDVENPDTVEERVRKAGRHFVIEYALFLTTDIFDILATDEDPEFSEDTEFQTKKSRIQGQLRDIVALLPADARAFRDQEWIGCSFEDGMKGMRSSIHTRLRSESLSLIVTYINRFFPEQSATVDDFDTSASRFAAFKKLIGYQSATADAAAFYSHLKAEVLYDGYDGTMNVDKIFRGPLLLIIYVSIIRGPSGAKGLFEGNSKLPSAKVAQRIHGIKRTLPGAPASAATWLIWFLSADTQLGYNGEGDETGINYKKCFEAFLRQICDGLRDDAEWAISLMRHWDEVLFPNAEDSLGQSTFTNQRAIDADIEAMDAAFRAAVAPRDDSPEPGPSNQQPQSSPSPPPRHSPPRASQPPRTSSNAPPTTRSTTRTTTRRRRR
ncbi:hypothetical protein C8F04DRAFT_1068796 [Mycena alexandri]|uniref:Uncharacterized protein n=1 Tax=Mycena alexandri TaxID=1745969 RepID=A0AAD6WWT1_9AGAR|nr:hypothetical protein C8F04DRAFT_1132560 [Mycena alexandri]KAJ7044578.1 hypothetical protein C8F04DRAFT_1068796 [Mycena alexandri]